VWNGGATELSGKHLLVLTTCGNPEDASKLAKTLVTRRLAACVNRLEGIVSAYRWESAVREDTEVLLLIKTTAERLGQVEASIKELSSYELPEILAVPIHSGSRDYLEWIAASVDPEE
ncbi:MAG TPA: divalent-cation tolerance protein CutA, partial [Gammaproteobacteria bacterium]